MKQRYAMFACLIVALSMGNAIGQNPYEEVEYSEYDIVLKTNPSSPSIVDFVTAYLENPEDELSGMLSDAWGRYLKNQPAEKGGTMVVDKRNGYVSYTLDYDAAYPEDTPTGDVSLTEMCYWNCDDGIHKLFAFNAVSTRNGEPMMGQYDGLIFYIYNKETHRMSFVHDIVESYEGDYRYIIYVLPRQGKNIEARIYTEKGMIKKQLVWNGYRFHFAK